MRAHIAYESPDADTETLIELVREACEDLIVGELTPLLSLDTVGHQVDRRRARCPDKIASAGF